MRVINMVRRFLQKLTSFVDYTQPLKYCTFRVAALVRRFRVAATRRFVSEASDETR